MKKSPAEEKQGQAVEDIFRNSFAEEGDPVPPARIWENLDRILENQELRQYRKQIGWYRAVAAAALLLLFSGALVLWQKESTGLGPTGALLGNVAPALRAPTAAQPNENSATAGSPKSVTSGLTDISEKEPLLSKMEHDATTTGRRIGTQSVAVSTSKPGTRAGKTFFTGRKNTGKLLQEARNEPTYVATATTLQPEIQPEAQLSLETGNIAPVSEPAVTLAATAMPERQSETILRQKEFSPSTGAAVAASAEQVKQLPEKEESRWSLAVAYSPQYAYTPVKLEQTSGKASISTFSNPEMAQEYQHAVAEYNKTYTPTYSFSTLVGASYKINAKWQIESGMLYTQNEATSHHSYMVSDNMLGQPPTSIGPESAKNLPLVANALNTDAAELSVSRAPEYSTRYKYQQLGVPVRVAYTHNMKKFFAYVSGGVHLNLLMQNSIEPEANQVETVRYSFTDKNSPFNVWQWATAASVGVGYEVNQNMRLLLAPEFTYSLTPMIRDEQQRTEAYQLGVSIGGRWRLSK